MGYVLPIAAATLQSLSFGTSVGWLVPSLAYLLSSKSHIKVTSEQGSWIVSTADFGAICGAFVASNMLNKFGRKITLIVISVPIIVHWLFIIFAVDIMYIYMARFCVGLATGMILCTLPTYISEVAPTKYRGAFGCCKTFGTYSGTILFTSLSIFMTPQSMAAYGIIIPIFSMFALLWIPESPHYWMLKGDYEKAMSCVIKLTGDDNIDEKMCNLKISAESNNVSDRMIDLFRAPMHRRSIVLMTILSFMIYGTSGTVVSNYAKVLFDYLDCNINTTYLTVTVTVAQFCASIGHMILIDRAGRRVMLLIMMTGVGFCSVYLIIHFYFLDHGYDVQKYSIVAAVFILLHASLFALSSLSIIMTMTTEMVSTSMRAYAVVYMSYVNNIFDIFITQICIFLNQTFGTHALFVVSFAFSFFGFVFVKFFLPETKQKTFQDIQAMIKKQGFVARFS